MTMTNNVLWINPNLCKPPHKVARPDQVIALAEDFAKHGWDPDYPALIGYYFKPENCIQLLSGSHRWAAAMKAGMERIPILVKPYGEIEEAWGTDKWRNVMNAPKAGSDYNENPR